MIKNTKHSLYQKMLNNRKDAISSQYLRIKKIRKEINDLQEYIFHADKETDIKDIDFRTLLIYQFNAEIKDVQEYIANNEKIIKNLKKAIQEYNR